MKPPAINKETHIETGKQIKLILSVLPSEHKYRWDAEKITPAGTIHTIVDRPNRKEHKNGWKGVWIEGVFGLVYAWYFQWVPYFAPKPMQRTKQNFVRTKVPLMQRTK